MIVFRDRISLLIFALVTRALLSMFSCVSELWAQSQATKDDFKLIVKVDLVGILATVTTDEGALVADLRKEDFQVYEDKKLQEIAVFAKEADQPLRLTVLFDSSMSIASELRTQQEAAVEFLQPIVRPVDRVSIFQVYEDVDEIVKSSNRLGMLIRAIRSIKPRGGTSLYDAIYLAAENLSETQGRKVIVVISDGVDTTSKTQLKDCLKMTQNSEVVVYPLVVQPIKSEPGRNLGGEHAMTFLAEKTGGKFFKITSADSLRASFATISDELRTQYYLAYYPRRKREGNEFRKIEIRVNQLAYKVRARDGYYPSSK